MTWFRFPWIMDKSVLMLHMADLMVHDQQFCSLEEQQILCISEY